ncbi:unnamed protein product [Camellia sinensis]
MDEVAVNDPKTVGTLLVAAMKDCKGPLDSDTDEQVEIEDLVGRQVEPNILEEVAEELPPKLVIELTTLEALYPKVLLLPVFDIGNNVPPKGELVGLPMLVSFTDLAFRSVFSALKVVDSVET